MPSVQCPQPSALSPVPSVQCPQPSALSPVPSVQYPQPSALSPVPSAQCLSPVPSVQHPEPSCHHTCREKKKTALSPVPSVQYPQSSIQSRPATIPAGRKKNCLSPVPSVQYPQSSTLSPASRAVPPSYLQGEKKTASTGKNSKEKRAELRPEKKSKQPGSWPGAPPHLGGKKFFFKDGVGPRANQSRLLELFFQGEPLLVLPRDSIPAETDQIE